MAKAKSLSTLRISLGVMANSVTEVEVTGGLSFLKFERNHRTWIVAVRTHVSRIHLETSWTITST